MKKSKISGGDGAWISLLMALFLISLMIISLFGCVDIEINYPEKETETKINTSPVIDFGPLPKDDLTLPMFEDVKK